MSAEPQSILPGFAAAPLDEALLAVQFEPLTVDSLLAASFRDKVKADFPKREEQLAQPPMGEDFSIVVPRPPVQIEVVRAPSMPRFWFLTDDEAMLVQLQHDFFALNWRQRPEGRSYPRYETMRESAAQYLRQLESILVEEERAFRPNWCEVSYINHVESEADEGDRVPLSVLLEGVDIPREGGFLPPLEDARLNVRFVVPDEGGSPRGRVNISVVAAFRNIDQAPIWVLTLTARLLAEVGRGIDGVLKTFDVGHEWVARAFKELTSDEMHKRWQTVEGA